MIEAGAAVEGNQSLPAIDLPAGRKTGCRKAARSPARREARGLRYSACANASASAASASALRNAWPRVASTPLAGAAGRDRLLQCVRLRGRILARLDRNRSLHQE